MFNSCQIYVSKLIQKDVDLHILSELNYFFINKKETIIDEKMILYFQWTSPEKKLNFRYQNKKPMVNILLTSSKFMASFLPPTTSFDVNGPFPMWTSHSITSRSKCILLRYIVYTWTENHYHICNACLEFLNKFSLSFFQN